MTGLWTCSSAHLINACGPDGNCCLGDFDTCSSFSISELTLMVLDACGHKSRRVSSFFILWGFNITTYNGIKLLLFVILKQNGTCNMIYCSGIITDFQHQVRSCTHSVSSVSHVWGNRRAAARCMQRQQHVPSLPKSTSCSHKQDNASAWCVHYSGANRNYQQMAQIKENRLVWHKQYLTICAIVLRFIHIHFSYGSFSFTVNGGSMLL